VELGYPGERLGLPETGRGSVAGFGARALAFVIDWVACALVAIPLLGDAAWATPVFLLEAFVGTWLGGGSFGQLIRRVRIVRIDGSRLGPGRALLRTLLLGLLVPALIWDRDGRGLHDRAAGTVCIRG
jgi:uncharacterized RDD family membrane protein YckC